MAKLSLEKGQRINFTVIALASEVDRDGPKVVFQGMTAFDTACTFSMKPESAERQLKRCQYTYESVKGQQIEFEKTAEGYININRAGPMTVPSAFAPPPAPTAPGFALPPVQPHAPLQPPPDAFTPPPGGTFSPPDPASDMDEIDRWNRYTSGYTVCVDHIIGTIVPRMKEKGVPFDAASVAAMVNTLAIGAKDKRLM